MILAISMGTAGAAIYLNPYSLHRVVVVSYDGFNAPPQSNGMVVLDGGALDFRFGNSSFAPATIAELRNTIGRAATDRQLVARCVKWVRGRLNATDAEQPKAETADAESLYREGRNFFCLCSEHAILLNEVLQVFGAQSRVLWLEGHVAAEYFDRDHRKWVFVDPHMNLCFLDPQDTPLSVAELIHAVERDNPVVRRRVCNEDGETHSLAHESIDHAWYRNVLLNGNCHALTGTTLRASSRWMHLLKFGQRPCMLVLATHYNAAPVKYLEPFRPHKCVLLVLAFVAGFYALRQVPAGLPSRVLGETNEDFPRIENSSRSIG